MRESLSLSLVRPFVSVLRLSPILFLTACTGGDDSAPTTEFPVGTPIAIDPVPTVSVGVVEGDKTQEFDRIVTPFLLSDGQLVVPLAGANSIRVFDEGGSFLYSLGTEGAGPGEFRSLNAAWSRGDTIEAIDSRLDRITRFIPGGSVEVVNLRSQVRDLAGVAGPVPEGWIAGGVAIGAAGRRDSVVLRWFDRSGTDRGEVGMVEGFARYRTSFLTGPEPLSPRPVLQVIHARAYVAESLTPEIRVLTPTGVLEREIVWQPEPVQSSQDVVTLVIDSAVKQTPPGRATAFRQHLEAASVPERLSVFWKFIVDDSGYIWIRSFEPLAHAAALGGLSLVGGGPGGRWSVLSPDGNVVTTIDVPADLEVVHISTAAVVGIARDALGVESVRVHRLERR